MIKFWAICRNTFVQTIRQPIYGVLLLLTLAVLVLELPLAGWTMGSSYHETDQKMLIELGLSTLLVAGLFLSAFSASSALTREIDDRTVMTVVSKPVPRSVVVLGKFAGVALAVTVAYYIAGLVFLMTVRHKVMPAASDPYDWPVIVLGILGFVLAITTALAGNFLFGWPFASAGVWAGLVLLSAVIAVLTVVGKGWAIIPFGEGISPQVVLAMVLLWMGVMLFVSVAVAASTRLGQAMTLLVCLTFFVLGSMHPFLFGTQDSSSPAGRLAGWVIPKLTHFHPFQSLAGDTPITGLQVWLAGAYSALYVAGVLLIGMALFQTRELESRGTSAGLPRAVGLISGGGRIGAVLLVLSALAMLLGGAVKGLTGAAGTAAMVVGAAAAWFICGNFGRGRTWAYWTVLALAFAVVAGYAVVRLHRPAEEFLSVPPVPATISAAVAALVLLTLLLPKTRRHFASPGT